MKKIRLYKAECLFFYNEEMFCDAMPNTKGLNTWTPVLEDAIKAYESIKFEDFDKKEVSEMRLKGYGNTYNKNIQICDMPKWLYDDCHESELGEKYTDEQAKHYLSDFVFHEDCNLNIQTVKDELFEVTLNGIENLRQYI